uniref:Uncharacterized protein n=1 Tax=virus sp. ctML55 TaxID=2827627 RepID=A0A8S5RJ25_9VIRU|nr:MAG TPA: hypothetical protein [virus sp. ctML55]DAG30376.1 MAG TPA: hypothetical protein [Bacteriophage sp.]DAW92026.1 MAG TPA: hypothetical protein [Bacteriophage sp.]
MDLLTRYGLRKILTPQHCHIKLTLFYHNNGI